MQLSVKDIFSHIARHPEMEFLLRFSYLEIYNERIYDLLAAGAKSEVKIFDASRNSNSSSGGNNTHSSNSRDSTAVKDVIIKGLREEIVVTMEHVLSLVEVGNLHRHMATTESNDQSSRSHVIFRMVRNIHTMCELDYQHAEAPCQFLCACVGHREPNQAHTRPLVESKRPSSVCDAESH